MRVLYDSGCYIITYRVEGLVLKGKFYGETFEEALEYFKSERIYDKIISIREELS